MACAECPPSPSLPLESHRALQSAAATVSDTRLRGGLKSRFGSNREATLLVATARDAGLIFHCVVDSNTHTVNLDGGHTALSEQARGSVRKSKQEKAQERVGSRWMVRTGSFSGSVLVLRCSFSTRTFPSAPDHTSANPDH